MLRRCCGASCAAFLVLVAMALPASSTDVVVFDEAAYGGPIGAFYSGSFGGPPASAAYVSEVTAQSLAGAQLFWALPADDFTPDEIEAMASFLAGGGRIAFLGEWYGFAGPRDASINGAVAALGGHIEIATTYADSGYPHYALRSNGRIVEDAFTAGVDSVVYGLFSPLGLGGSAVALIFGEDGTSVLLAYEPVGAGLLVVMADQNPWDLDPYSAGTDTRVLFTNLLTAPEPAHASVVALGALLLFHRGTRRGRVARPCRRGP